MGMAGRISMSRWIPQASLLYRNKHDGTFEETPHWESGVALSEHGPRAGRHGRRRGGLRRRRLAGPGERPTSSMTCQTCTATAGCSFSETTIQGRAWHVLEVPGWGSAFVDYDNDGWPDIFMVNGHVYPGTKSGEYRQRRILYRNGAAGRFVDVSAEAGAAVMTKTSARGLALWATTTMTEEPIYRSVI